VTATPTDSPVHNRRITETRPLLTPRALRSGLPLPVGVADHVAASRAAIGRILDRADERLLVVVGPCSIHDPAAALDYASRLAELAQRHRRELMIVMRVYFEKPRTTLGWKGLINDPGLDGSFRVNDGLGTARKVVLQIAELGLPVGCEFLDPITPQYLADVVSWGSIGARTAQSQIHRQLASGLSMPVGIKNSTEGDIQAAVDAVAASAASHVFPGIDDDGRAAVFTTTGNVDCHVILRGAASGPNYDAETVTATSARLKEASLRPTMLIDASHGNSQKDPARQLEVLDQLARRLARGERHIAGVMIESFLERGRQDLTLGQAGRLAYGLSITDACIGWDDTVGILGQLATGVS
jgi:3-deoxy-7-phosphoheptulonate synthase